MKKKCKNCIYWLNARYCNFEGWMLVPLMLNRYTRIGFTKEEAAEKSWYLPEATKNHSCKHWMKNEKKEKTRKV